MECKKIFNAKRLKLILLMWIISCVWFYRLNAGTQDDERKNYRIEQAEYVNQYEANIQNVIDTSETLLELSILQNSHSFVRNNLLKTRYDFIKLKEIPVKSGDYFGFMKAYQYEPMFFFCLASMFIIISSFNEEKKSNFSLVLHASKNGRIHLLMKRFFILVFTSFFVTCLYEVSTYSIGIAMYHDNFDYSAPIQSIQEFGQSILHINLMELCLLKTLIDAVVVLSFSMIFWLLMELIHSKNLIILCYTFIIVIESILYHTIRNQSTFNIFKYCNLTAIFNIKKYIFSYSNYGFSNWITETYHIILGFAIMIIFLVLIALIINYEKCDSSRKNIKIISIIQYWELRLKEKIFVRLPLVFMEVYKQFIIQRGLYVLLIAICVLLYSRLSVGVSHDEVQAGLEKYYEEVTNVENQEQYTTEYLNKIDQWLTDADYKLFEYEQNNNVYRIQLLREEIHVQGQIKNEIEKEQKYRLRQAEENVRCGIIPQQEFQSITGNRMDSFEETNALIALIAVIVASYGLIAYEKKTNMLCMINSSSIGNKRYIINKVYALFVITFMFWIILYGLNFLNLVKVYDLQIHDFHYSVQSIMTMENYPLHISIGMYFLLKNIKRFIIMLLIAMLGLGISIKISYKNGVFLCALLFLPYILDAMGIPLMKFLSAIYWMKIC